MRITLFGTGYVGLVTGTCFAEVGNDVVCVDIDAHRVAQLNQGICPIFEPQLEELLVRNQKSGRLQFTTDAKVGIDHGEVLFLCVGTPPKADGSSDLSAIESVATAIGQQLDHEAIVVNKSTVPVGTADRVHAIIRQKLDARGIKLAVEVASNPEFLKEGAAIEDFQRPDRIIVGTSSTSVMDTMRELYAPFNRNHNRLMFMDVRSAEFTKYAANAMLATKISFMNEMANIAERIGVNIESVRAGIGSDPRIGYSFIYPGAGFGGSCFPKDVWSLEREAASVGYDASLLRSVNAINDHQKQLLFKKINAFFDGNVEGKTVAVWGLAFKPKTDDMREAPSRVLMEALWEHGATVQAFDPAAMEVARSLYPEHIASGQLVLTESADDSLEGADVLAICTEWREFQMPDYDAIRTNLQYPVVFDGRNILDPLRVEREGITYFGIGVGQTALPA